MPSHGSEAKRMRSCVFLAAAAPKFWRAGAKQAAVVAPQALKRSILPLHVL